MSDRRFKSVERMTIQERFDYAEMVRQAIAECMRSVGLPEFSDKVQFLCMLIPEGSQDEEFQAEYHKHFDNKIVTWKYREWCGRKLGTPENPVLDNDPTDRLNYDPSKPSNPISPVQVEEEDPDWQLIFRAAFNQLVRLKIAVRMQESG